MKLAKVIHYLRGEPQPRDVQTLEEQLEQMTKLYMETITLAGSLVPITDPFPVTFDCRTVTIHLDAMPRSGLLVVCQKVR